MNGAKPVKTPLPDTLQLKTSDGDPMDDPHLYRQVIGSLQYACLTRPDIAYVVNKLYKYMSNPTTTHWQSYKRVLRYFKEIVNQGLFFFPSSTI